MASLIALWEQAGWGTLTAQQWEQWYELGPCGPCIVALALEGESIVGQMILSPSRLAVGNRDVLAMRISAPILDHGHRAARAVSMANPFVGMMEVAMHESRRRGVDVVYALPQASWLPFVRRGRRLGKPLLTFATAEPGCVATTLDALNDRSLQLAAVSSVSPVVRFGPEHEALWQRARDGLPIHCGVIRSHEWMQFRNGDQLALDVRDAATGRLVGYSAVRRDSGLLHDVLAATMHDLEQVLAATMHWLAGEHATSVDGTTSGFVLKAMDIPMLHDAYRRLGFTAVDYHFGFMCTALDHALEADIAPERWFLMPAD